MHRSTIRRGAGGHTHGSRAEIPFTTAPEWTELFFRRRSEYREPTVLFFLPNKVDREPFPYPIDRSPPLVRPLCTLSYSCRCRPADSSLVRKTRHHILQETSYIAGEHASLLECGLRTRFRLRIKICFRCSLRYSSIVPYIPANNPPPPNN